MVQVQVLLNSSETKSQAQGAGTAVLTLLLGSPRDPAGARQPPGNTGTEFAVGEGCGEGFLGPSLVFFGGLLQHCKNMQRVRGFLLMKYLFVWTI